MISLPTNHFPCFTISQLSRLSFYRAYLPLLARLGGEAVCTQNIHTAMSYDVLRVSLGFYDQLVAFMLRLSILSDVFEIKLRRNKISAGNEGKSAKSMASVFLTTARGSLLNGNGEVVHSEILKKCKSQVKGDDPSIK